MNESKPNTPHLEELSRAFREECVRAKYGYRFEWMGRPIIQFPQDIVAMQELIWRIKPDCIVECGIAHGGSLVFYASMLELAGAGRVIGVDVEIRPHNRQAIESHPMFKRIELIEGSSIDPQIVARVHASAAGAARVLVVLDSSHTRDHVLAELRAYAPLVRPGSYIVVFDTVVETLPPDVIGERPWGAGNSPLTAVRQFLRETPRFEADRDFDARYLVTCAPNGFLRCVA